MAVLISRSQLTNVRSRRQNATHQIARHFEQDVSNEEREQCNIVIVASHLQVFGHALDSRIANLHVDVSPVLRALLTSRNIRSSYRERLA